MSALIEAARAALEAWDSLPRKTYSLSMSVSEWLEYRMAPAIARLRTALAAAEQPAEPVGLFGIRAIVQQAALALEELGGPGYLIGGVMHHRIGLILPKLNEAIDALAAAPTAPAQAPTDEFVYRVVRSVQPHLDDTCKAWGQEFAQCKYWLDAAHGIGSKA